MRRSLPIALAVAWLLLATACGSGAAVPVAEASAPVLAGEVTALDGTTVDLADYQGHDVVLWFWAPW
ncbi:MAG: hypothetical protein AAFN30_06520 [Actinomycetota bacterium]